MSELLVSEERRGHARGMLNNKSRGASRSITGEERGAEKRSRILERLADEVLLTGLDAASLRPLANAIGTSDRMLLYYFPDKETLIRSILGCIVQRLVAILDERFPSKRLIDSDGMLRALWRSMREPLMHPYMQIWLELAAHAARGKEPHRTIGASIATGLIDWTAARLSLAKRDQRREAVSILTRLEGMLLLDAFGIETRVPRSKQRRKAVR